MPQSSDDMHDIMDFYFKNGGISDTEPMQFLLSRGYTEARGIISHPDPNHFVTLKEELCIRFMFEEWDYDFKRKEDSNADSQ